MEPQRASGKFSYNYHGIDIQFPFAAYESQQQQMDSVIQGVTTGRHCLLESPTGTGKSAALLCSLLAWQKQCYSSPQIYNNVIDKRVETMGGCTCGLIKDNDLTQVTLSIKNNRKYSLTAITFASIHQESDSGILPHPPIKGDILSSEDRRIENCCSYCQRKYIRDISRPPRIYYCTRTLSQISQLIDQLKATPYNKTKMTILSSRNSTCISELKIDAEFVYQELSPQQKLETSKPSTQEICNVSTKKYWEVRHTREKLEETCEKGENCKLPEYPDQVCSYYLPPIELRPHFEKLHAAAWDFSDVKSFGETCHLCPYYGSQSLHDTSDIIFCSYNYILDPILREQTGIHLSNSVIVFDEAHNIEETCRDFYSLKFNLSNFEVEVLQPFAQLVEFVSSPRAEVSDATRTKLSTVLSTMQTWCEWIRQRRLQDHHQEQQQQLQNEHVIEEFDGERLHTALVEMGLTYLNVHQCLENLGQQDEEEEMIEYTDIEAEFYFNDKDERKQIRVPILTIQYLQKMAPVLKCIFNQIPLSTATSQQRAKYSLEFKGFLLQKVIPSKSNKDKENLLTFEILCLNSAIGFGTVRDCSYSVIVASGTLSPMDSFASELDTNFEIQLKANHIVPQQNVWAAVVKASGGPLSIPLRLVSSNQSNSNVQIALGNIICDICNIVPNGILVFFPSYHFMETVLQRWRFRSNLPVSQSIIDRIEGKKQCFQEVRDKDRFNEIMIQYKENVNGNGQQNGCILFAVFKGKVSEGLDFKDEMARAVITVGIPYPNYFAHDIIAKKNYNDAKKLVDHKTMSGDTWYAIQAFRAFNQALGRCFRHKKDWAALIMIDERLNNIREQTFFPPWLQKNIRSSDEANPDNLKAFIIRMHEKMERFKTIATRRRQLQIQYET